MIPIGVRALDFGARPDISARSVLVTIFGDAIVPTGGEVWLGDLIELAAPFGFSDRLVRTSMYRLTAEGWFHTERIGRRSRYRLTERAIGQFADAEGRIYAVGRPAWSGEWTLAFLGSDALDRERRGRLVADLTSSGFGRLGAEVLAFPGEARERVVRATGAHGFEVPILVSRPDDRSADPATLPVVFDLEPAAARYRAFVDGHAWSTKLDHRALTDRDSFIVRTITVHEIRRATLVDPWLPSALLPTDWPGDDARALAAISYDAVAGPAWRWLEKIAGLDRPAQDSPAGRRFTTSRPVLAG
jgi:phenylacetic acid degradation operon negative regulatory protein